MDNQCRDRIPKPASELRAILRERCYLFGAQIFCTTQISFGERNMTESEYDQLFAYLARALEREDFQILGDEKGGLRIVFSDLVVRVSPRSERQFMLQNKFFRLSHEGEQLSPSHRPIIQRVQEATGRFAEEQPWFVETVETGRVFLKESERLVELLVDTENPHRSLFGVLEELRAKYERNDGPFRDMFQFSSLRSLFFQLANVVGAEAPTDEAEFGPFPALPPGLRVLFLNLLWGTMFLSEELEQYVFRWRNQSGADVHMATDRASLQRLMSQNTVVFCMGLREDPEHQGCVQFLVDHASTFRSVVLVDVGNWSFGGSVVPKNMSLYLTPFRSGPLYRSLPPQNRIPYIPAVSREILRWRMSVQPTYDFFVCSNEEQEPEFLLSHQSFFSQKKLLIGTKGVYRESLRELWKRFPDAVFIPEVPLRVYLLLWQLAKTVVVMYPDTWEKPAYTITTALLCGRGLMTSPHPAIAEIDRSCFLVYERAMPDAEMEKAYCTPRETERAARDAERFACETLEFHKIVERIVRRTLDALESGAHG
jgi:hypothetical protein